MNLKDHIRSIPDFPKPGIIFKDISPLLANPQALGVAIQRMADLVDGAKVDRICAMESRGFLFGTPLALKLNVGFTPIRKPGKLPWKTYSAEYDLEYGSNTLEMHVDALEAGQNIVIIDDLLATGGTVSACVELCRRAGANPIGSLFVIELEGLGARELLARGQDPGDYGCGYLGAVGTCGTDRTQPGGLDLHQTLRSGAKMGPEFSPYSRYVQRRRKFGLATGRL